jgi:molybdenum cofactor biosynthesis protein B
MSSKYDSTPLIPLGIAVLTVSDTRSLAQDTSGQFLADAVVDAGHQLLDRQLIPDDVYRLRAVVSNWIADERVDAVLVTGGTGFTARDVTPQALRPLFDREIDGFSAVFHRLSYDEIDTSTLQSRALGGFANQTVIFCLPGSTGACRTGWNGVLRSQLDSRHRPCNFVSHTRAMQRSG